MAQPFGISHCDDRVEPGALLHVLVDDVVLAGRLREAFADRLWLEIIRPRSGAERAEAELLACGRRLGLPPVASTACHFAVPDYYPTFRLAAAVRRRTLLDRLPPILKRWDALLAPRPDPVDDLMAKFSMCSPWTSINVLMLDHRRLVVEASQVTLQRALKDWGFEPLPLPFLAYGPFGGAFHCATLDTRRRGALKDYF